MKDFEREDDEILRYYEKVKINDPFHIWGTEFLLRVPLEKAEKFMSPDHGWTPETWEKSMMKKDHQSLVFEIEDYFQFSWELALAHNGMGCSKSLHHYMAWAWLLNDMELFDFCMHKSNFINFLCPVILSVGQLYELTGVLPEQQLDQFVFNNMAQGKPCLPNCQRGCGVGQPKLLRPFDFKSKSLILPKK